MILLKPQSFLASDGACLNRINGIRFLLLSALFCFFSTASAAPLLQTDTDVATAGYYQLSWQASSSAPQTYVLEESGNENFTSVKETYRGSDRASVISGKADGRYFYRVKLLSSGESEYSEPVLVTVKHHTLYKAWWFFLLGAIVFIGTVGVIYRGNRAAGLGDG